MKSSLFSRLSPSSSFWLTQYRAKVARLAGPAPSVIEQLEHRTLYSTVVWNGGGADNNWMTAANWVGGVAPTVGDSLNFAGTTRTNTTDNYSAGTSFGSIEIATSGFILSGNQAGLTGGITLDSGVSTATVSLPIALAGAQSITTAPGAVLSFSGVLSGIGTLTKAGAGTLVLTGTNTFIGGTALQAGIVNINADAALGTAPVSVGTNVSFTGSATLQAGGSSVTLAATRGISIANSVTATLDTQGNNLTINGPISNSASNGALAKAGAGGTLILAGNDSFSAGTTINMGGSTNVSAGVLELTSSAALGSNAITVDAHYTQNNAIATLALAGGITVGSNVTYLVGGHQPAYNVDLNSLSGNNTFNGIFAIDNTGGNYAIQSSQAGSTLTLGGSLTEMITNLNRQLIFQGSGKGVIAGVISNGSGSIAPIFNGNMGTTWSLNSVQSYTGATSVNGGTLKLNVLQPYQGTITGGAITVSNGVLEIAQDNALIGWGNGPVGVTLNTGGTLLADPGVTTHAGNITLNGGSITAPGNTRTDYGSLGVQSGAVIHATATSTIAAPNIVMTTGASFQIDAGQTLNITGNLIDGSGGAQGQVTLSGPGTLNLAASNTYTGATTVNSGALVVSGSVNSVVIVKSTGTYKNGKVSPAPWTNSDIGSPSLAGSTTFNTDGTYAIAGSGSDISASADQLNFLSQSFVGDGGITAKVNGSPINTDTTTTPSSKDGIMFRENTFADSSFVEVGYTTGVGVQLLYRDGNAQAVQTGGTVASVSGAIWLSLNRVQGAYTASYSTDGITFNTVGTVSTNNVEENALAGLAICSHDNTKLATATFSNVSITNALVSSTTEADVAFTVPWASSSDTLIYANNGVTWQQLADVPSGQTSKALTTLTANQSYTLELASASAVRAATGSITGNTPPTLSPATSAIIPTSTAVTRWQVTADSSLTAGISSSTDTGTVTVANKYVYASGSMQAAQLAGIGVTHFAANGHSASFAMEITAAGSTGHTAPFFESSLAELLGIASSTPILAIEDWTDGDFNDAFASIQVTAA